QPPRVRVFAPTRILTSTGSHESLRRWRHGDRSQPRRLLYESHEVRQSGGVSGVNYSFPSCCLIQKCYRTYRTNSAKNNCTAALVVENGFWSVKRRQALPEGNLPRNSRLETHRSR